MPQSVYIETTIISYLTAWPSRDLIRAAQQQITRDWWNFQRPSFDLYASQFVRIEAAAGDPTAAADRLAVLSKLPVLEITEQALQIARELVITAALPPKAVRDAEHVGVAAASGIEFLMTWNCRHLANARQHDKIIRVCNQLGLRAPVICTPEELFGANDD